MWKLVAFCLLVSSTSVLISGSPRHEYNQNYGSNGNLMTMELYVQEAKPYVSLPPQKEIKSFDNSDIKFYLYTKEVPRPQELVLNDPKSLMSSSFNPKMETKIIIHDYYSNEQMVTEMVAAYLYNQTDYLNVITVSYAVYAGVEFVQFLEIQNEIGNVIAIMLKCLHTTGVHPDTMHIIGMGVGAHIAGIAANKIFPLTVGRITGLDPTGLNYDEYKNLGQLTKNCCEYVDVILTTSPKMGTNELRGQIQFYPNAESGQSNFNVYQNHMKAYQYFVESIVRPYAFKAHRAKNYAEFLQNKRGVYDFMGENVSRKYHGYFYLNTNNYPPFGQNTEYSEKMW